MLAKQHTVELRETHRRIIEHTEDRIAIGNRERDDVLVGIQRGEKRIARVHKVGREQEPSEVGNVLFADGNAGEPHATDVTRRNRPTNRLDGRKEFAEPGTFSSTTSTSHSAVGGRTPREAFDLPTPRARRTAHSKNPPAEPHPRSEADAARRARSRTDPTLVAALPPSRP